VNILVIGAGGFIGSHLVETLVRRGHYVTALCKYNSSGKYGWLDNSDSIENERLEFALGDVTDTEQVYNLVSNHELTINMSALIGIPYSYQAPRSYLNINTLGTLNVLEATRKFDSRMIQISTSEVYGTPKSVPIRLDHPINPQSPYSASKAAADLLVKSYTSSFETKALIVRPFNTFGPRQSMRAVIPTILNQILSGRGVVKLGSVDVRRDFTYVDDTVDGIVGAAESALYDGRVIQLGTGISYSIDQVLQLCRDAFNCDFEVLFDEKRVRPLASEVEVLQSDPTSAFEDLGWKYKIELKDGLIQTFDWMLEQGINLNISGRYYV
jgi:UDP-glucose 4-epimerase